MSNEILPVFPGLQWENDWSPQFKTSIKEAASGKEYRSSLMAAPKYHFRLKIDWLRESKNELQQLAAFFLDRRGSFDSFLYVHPSDNAVTDQLMGVGTGVTKVFQLVRGLGGAFVEPVCNLNQVLAIKVNGVALNPATDYTISATGMVSFSNAPVGNITWTGSYYYRCHFTKDNIDFKGIVSGIHSPGIVEMVGSLGTLV